MCIKNLFFCGATAVLVAAAAAVGINRNSNENVVGDVTLANIEALASYEWNEWYSWLSQGFTQDEREEQRVCGTNTSFSAGGSVSVNTGTAGGSVSGNVSSSGINSSSRFEYICPAGYANCTAVGC